jgi:hypothetical protein
MQGPGRLAWAGRNADILPPTNGPDVPTLFRFLRFVLTIVVLVVAAALALAMLVKPMTREMREPLPRSFIDDAGANPEGAAP